MARRLNSILTPELRELAGIAHRQERLESAQGSIALVIDGEIEGIANSAHSYLKESNAFISPMGILGQVTGYEPNSSTLKLSNPMEVSYSQIQVGAYKILRFPIFFPPFSSSGEVILSNQEVYLGTRECLTALQNLEKFHKLQPQGVLIRQARLYFQAMKALQRKTSPPFG